MIRRARRPRAGARLAVLAAGAMLACAGGGLTPGGAAIPGAAVGGDDRVVVRAHDRVLGVAASSRHVFALTTGGLLAYDRVFARWLLPSASLAEDLRVAGLAGEALPLRPAVMAADPVEDAAWIGVTGAVVIVRPRLAQVVRVPVAGQPDAIAFARGGGDAFVRAGGQWTRVSRAGFARPLTTPPPAASLVVPAQLEDVYREHPALRAQLPFLLRDGGAGRVAASGVAASGVAASGAAARITAGTLSPDRPGEAWVGTWGDGLWAVDARFLSALPLPYGVQDDDVGAVAAGDDGAWTAGQGGDRRFALSWVADDLARARWPRPERAPPGADGARATVLARRGDAAWLGTDRGVYAVRPDAGAATERWGRDEGLPDDVVLAVLPRVDGVWIGTRRGLAHLAAPITGDLRAVQPVPAGFVGEAVTALAAIGDRLFVGTPRGLFVRSAVPDPGDDRAPEPVAALPPRPVRALAATDSLLVVAGDRDVRFLHVPSARGIVRAIEDPAAPAPWLDVAPVIAVAADARAVWVAGTRGVLSWSRGDASDLPRTPRVLRAGIELPAEATGVALGATFAWVGTRQGLVRVRRASDGGLR